MLFSFILETAEARRYAESSTRWTYTAEKKWSTIGNYI